MIEYLKRLPVSLQLFVVCFIQSGLCTINFRAIAHTNYGIAFASDILLFLFAFFIVKKIVEAKEFSNAFWYALGGACGGQACIYISQHLLGS